MPVCNSATCGRPRYRAGEKYSNPSVHAGRDSRPWMAGRGRSNDRARASCGPANETSDPKRGIKMRIERDHQNILVAGHGLVEGQNFFDRCGLRKCFEFTPAVRIKGVHGARAFVGALRVLWLRCEQTTRQVHARRDPSLQCQCRSSRGSPGISPVVSTSIKREQPVIRNSSGQANS